MVHHFFCVFELFFVMVDSELSGTVQFRRPCGQIPFS
jgi:hypothetical protein